MFVILFWNNIFPYTIFGPLASRYQTDAHFEKCNKFWWSNLLFINNFWPEIFTDGVCICIAFIISTMYRGQRIIQAILTKKQLYLPTSFGAYLFSSCLLALLGDSFLEEAAHQPQFLKNRLCEWRLNFTASQAKSAWRV